MKRLFGLSSVEDASTGTVTVIQQFDSALRLNVHRLTEMGDGDVRYELKKAWRDGTHFVKVDPYDLIARICAMVPPPRFHMVRFHGVLAPNGALRAQVVASARPYVPPHDNTAPNPVQLPLFGGLFDEPDVSRARRKPWAWLLRHVFAIDVNVCPKCAGPMKWREVALTADAIRPGVLGISSMVTFSLSPPSST